MMTVGDKGPGGTPQQQGRALLAPPKAEAVPVDRFCPDAVGSSAAPPTVGAEKEWTVLLYCGANNNSSSYRAENLTEIESVGSRKNVNIVCQIELKEHDCKRYYISAENDPSKPPPTMQELVDRYPARTSPVLENLGRLNMGDPKALAGFLAYGMKAYPARHYMLIMASHGQAWEGLQLGACGVDMSVPRLREAVEQGEKEAGRKLDFLAFDACFMGSTEVACELKDTARYMVASEQMEGFKAWRYGTILAKAFADERTITPLELGSLIVDESAAAQQDAVTMGVIDLGRMGEVQTGLDALADQILVTATPMEVLRQIARSTQGFHRPVKDLFHFAQQISTSPAITDEKLKDAARDLVSALGRAVVKEEHATSIPPESVITDSDFLAMSHEQRAALYELHNAHGLSVELQPAQPGYQELQLARDTPWARAIARIHGDAGAPA